MVLFFGSEDFFLKDEREKKGEMSYVDWEHRGCEVVKGSRAYSLICCVNNTYGYYTTAVVPLGLNKLSPFGKKIETLFVRWERCFFLMEKKEA